MPTSARPLAAVAMTGGAVALAAAAGVVSPVVVGVGPALVAVSLLLPALRADGKHVTPAILMVVAWVAVIVLPGLHFPPLAVAGVAIVASVLTVRAVAQAAGTTLPRVIRLRAGMDAVTVALSACLAARLLWEITPDARLSWPVVFGLLASGSVAFAVAVTVWVQSTGTSRVRTVRYAMAATALVPSGAIAAVQPTPGETLNVAAIGVCLGLALWASARNVPDADVPGHGVGVRPVEVWVITAAVAVAAVTVMVSGAVRWADSIAGILTAAVGGVLIIRLHVDQHEEAQMAAAAEAQAEAQTVELRRREERFRSLVAYSSDIVTLLDGNGIIRYQSLSLSRMLGWRPEELIGHTIESLVFEDDRSRLLALLEPSRLRPGDSTTIEARLLRRDGSICEAETTVSNLMANPAVGGLVLTSRDTTVRKQLEEQLRKRAFYDALTGLGNRVLFRDRLDHAVSRVRRYGGSLAVMFLDLDGFKQVNDTVGHDAGDQLLVSVADRLRECLRTSDTIARMGGDEFAVVLESPEDVRRAEAVAGKIIAALQLPVELPSGSQLRVACSIGIDIAGGHDIPTSDDLLRNADLAMYRAKALGKGRAQVFESSLREAAVGRARLESELRRAVDNDELVLYFQPVVALPSGDITGVEALVRWRHPERGLVPPNDFIPVAEESDLILEIGRWALARACTVLAAITVPEGRPEPWVAVNVAARQLAQPGLVQAIRSALGRSGLDPGRLVLEITEGSLLDDPRSTGALFYQLKEMGVRIAIDDFGTGYSSLSRLRTFPVDKLKIDRSFIQEILSPTDEAPIVAAVMAMAHNLGLTAVAEGVETVAQLTCLHSHGCEEAQGFLLARPLPSDELPALFASTDRLLGTELALDSAPAVDAAMSFIIPDAAHDSDQAVGASLLTELARQVRADSVWTAEIGSGVERVTAVHSLSPASPKVGQVIARDGVGEFFRASGQGMPGSLADLGIKAAVIVPIFDDSRTAIGVLGAGFVGEELPPSSTTVLLELFTRLLAEQSLTPDATPRPPEFAVPVSAVASSR